MTPHMCSRSPNHELIIIARSIFHRNLALESLDEAGFLHLQARFVREGGLHPWAVAEPFEARRDAHVLALEDPDTFPDLDSLENLEDPGTRYALIRALCLQGRREELSGVLDLVQPEAFRACLEALTDGLPEDWMGPVLDDLTAPGAPPQRIELAWFLVGRRRYLPGLDRLLASLPSPAWAWALGRVGSGQESAWSLLQKALTAEDPDLALQAALALLRLGNRECLEQKPFAGLHRALAGLEPVGGDPMALGLWGQPEAVPPLLEALADPERAPMASRALFALTGAPLKEEIFVPDAPEAEPPAEGPPEGDMMTRLSQDPAAWQGWWQAHAHRFKPNRSYCLGKPAEAPRLLEALAQEETPHWLRGYILEILAIRHGIHLPMETDMPVKAQKAALQKADATPRVSPRIQADDWKTAMVRGVKAEEERTRQAKGR